MQNYVNSYVFQPPQLANDLLHVERLKRKPLMRYTRKPDGVCLFYLSFDCKGRIVTETSPLPSPSDTVILFSHGNAEDLSICFHYLEWLSASLKVAVVGYDYTGYGFSKDPDLSQSIKPSEKSVYSDADHMYSHMRTLGYSPQQVILMGRSVGGGPTSYLAEKHHSEVAGLVLVSTFTSCLRVVSSCCLPLLCGCFDLFPNHQRLEHVTECPILILHGKDDHVVPFRCSCEMLDSLERQRRHAREKILKKRQKTLHAPMSRKADSGANDSAAVEDCLDKQVRSSLCPTPRVNSGNGVTLYDVFQGAYEQLVPRRITAEAANALSFTENDASIGVFHRWFDGCDHNDLEVREAAAFINTLLCFTRYSAIVVQEKQRRLALQPS